jgi:hypothetical protein
LPNAETQSVLNQAFAVLFASLRFASRFVFHFGKQPDKQATNIDAYPRLDFHSSLVQQE